MKSEEIKQKALSLYLNSLSIEKISEQTKVNTATIKNWKKRYKWDEIKNKTIQKISDNSPEKYSKIISDQIKIGDLAQKELIIRLERQEKNKEEIIKLQEYLNPYLIKEEKSDEDKEIIANTIEVLKGKYKELMGNYDLINIEKHSLEVVRPKTQTQFNFLKQDNNPTYTFEIIRPNNDSQNSMETESKTN